MASLYNSIAAKRTAEGSPLNPELALDMFGNDWSMMGGPQNIYLELTTLASTASSFATKYNVWVEIPTYSIDASFDELEFVVVMRIEAKVTTGTAEWRLANDGATLTGNAVSITDTGFSLTGYSTLVYTTASIPTGQTKMQIQARWPSDPGGATLSMKRAAITQADCDMYVRIKP